MDYTPIEAFLVGRCGKTVKEAAMTSLGEFNLLMEGHNGKVQEEWERTRWQVFMQWSISPNLKKRPRTPQDIVRFPWEKNDAPVVDMEPLTEAEIAGICSIFGIERKDVRNGQD